LPALILGTSLSVWLFSAPEDVSFLQPALIEGILVGSASAFVTFEVARLAGFNLYFGGSRKAQCTPVEKNVASKKKLASYIQ
jgi:hypothetical protein